MSYKILTIPVFEKQLKRLAKKFPSLKNEFAELLDDLELNPEQGKSLGKNCYKIRLAIASKGKGKSGGARIIFHILISDEIMKENLTDSELQELLNQINEDNNLS